MSQKGVKAPTKYEQVARTMFRRFNQFIKFKQFLHCVDVGDPDECWEWKGSRFQNGRGAFFWRDEKIVQAHVAAYRLFVGSIPKKHGRKLCVCHSCDNPPCVNPSHLWLGTNQQNMDDMVEKGRSLHRHGEKNPNAKLNLEVADKIRHLHKKGYSIVHLAKKFGVSRFPIYQIINYKKWVQ